jgi:hypothetical protein
LQFCFGQFHFQRPRFTIQFKGSRTNRAATAVWPLWSCNATTLASVLSDPSAFSTRNCVANSSGMRDVNMTSRGVPNSITVSSLQTSPAESIPVTRTGIWTGVASGKNWASLPAHDSPAEIDATLAS